MCHSPTSAPLAQGPRPLLGAQTGKGPCPRAAEPAAFRTKVTPDRAGGAGSGFLYKHPQTWQDPPGIPDSEGSPNPTEVPRTCWVPQPHCVPPSLPAHCTPWTLTLQGPSSTTTLRDAPPTKFLRALQGPQTLLGPRECPNTTKSLWNPKYPRVSPHQTPQATAGVPRPCWVPSPHRVPETLQDLPGTLKDA